MGGGFDEINAALLAQFPALLEQWLPGGVRRGHEYHPTNPKRRDDHPNGPFSINVQTGAWFDSRADVKGGDPISLFAYLQDLTQGEALQRLSRTLGLNGNRTLPDRAERRGTRKNLGREVAVYPYVDEAGVELFQTVRFEPKDFRQRHRAADGSYVWTLRNVRLVPFRLDRIVQSRTRADGKPAKWIVIVEGERDVLSLEEVGNFIASTSPLGAKKWRPEYNEHFRGRRIAVIPDNDEIGRSHAQFVERNLKGVATEVKNVELPDLPEHGDASDFIALRREQGRGDIEIRDEIRALIEAAPVVTRQVAEALASNSSSDDGSNDRGGQATQLVKVALQRVIELFHDGDDCYVVVQVEGHQETHRIDSRAFRGLLSRWYFEETEKAPNAESLTASRNVLEAKARFEGSQRTVFLRVANCEHAIYIDLGSQSWQQIEVKADGRRIIESKDSPARFRRTKGTLPLPMPERGGSIDLLRQFINLACDADFILLVAFIVMALSGRGPYPVLLLRAGHGGAKSTALRVLRRLIDPNLLALRAWPKEPRDFAIAAENSLALFFDNASSIPQWLSDLLCQAATGGGFAVRTHYQDREEELFTFTRPVGLSAIKMIIVSPDLEDRALIIDLPPIAAEKRLPETEFWLTFESACPKIFGTILDGLTSALRNRNAIHLDHLPRMADFARWSAAAMPAFNWTAEDFMSAYTENQKDANASTLESNQLAPFIQALAPGGWDGSASELLALINEKADESAKRRKSWPANARSLSNALRTIAPNLLAIGISVQFVRDAARRTITIRTLSDGDARHYDVSKTAENAEIDRLAAADATGKEGELF